MLHQISSDVFKINRFVDGPIFFQKHFNVIVGDSDGSNSIGKTTFLYAIDFAFGGDDYATKLKDVIENVGHHTINFAFMFHENLYYFSRNTIEHKIVNVCDKNYDILNKISLDEYRQILLKNYTNDCEIITFRGLISKFCRIHNRGNLDVCQPLKSAEKEATTQQIISLLKQFNYYSPISTLENTVKRKKDEKSTLSKAQKYDFIKIINKTEYKKIEKEISLLEKEKEKYTFLESSDLLKLDSKQAEKLIEKKDQLSLLKRERSKLKSAFNKTEQYMNDINPNFNSYYKNLLSHFPNIDLKPIQETEQFHQQICRHLIELFVQQKNNLEKDIAFVDQEINQLSEELKNQGITAKISKTAFDQYANITSNINNLKKAQQNHLDFEALKAEIKNSTDELEQVKLESCQIIEDKINNEMKNLNTYIYPEGNTSPVLSISKTNKYNLFTPKDTGTGIGYKGLIVFDLACLKLTTLPLVIHDSLLFKNIENFALEKIIDLYSLTKKQVFIAFDKTINYSEKTQAKLNQHTILTLSKGQPLFGKLWNKK